MIVILPSLTFAGQGGECVGHCYYYPMVILRALLHHHYCVIMCHVIGFLMSYATQEVSEALNGIRKDPVESTREEA